MVQYKARPYKAIHECTTWGRLCCTTATRVCSNKTVLYCAPTNTPSLWSVQETKTTWNHACTVSASSYIKKPSLEPSYILHAEYKPFRSKSRHAPRPRFWRGVAEFSGALHHLIEGLDVQICRWFWVEVPLRGSMGLCRTYQSRCFLLLEPFGSSSKVWEAEAFLSPSYSAALPQSSWGLSPFRQPF